MPATSLPITFKNSHDLEDGLKAKNKETSLDTVKFVEDLKRQWMATVDAMVDPLMIVNQDYTISKANLAMAHHADMPIRDIIGAKCYQVFANRSQPCPGCQLKTAWTKKTPQNFNLENTIQDHYHEVTSQPILNVDGSLHGVLQVYRDRTVAQQLQNQLAQHEKLAAIGLLAGGIAHELNNPIGGILVFAQMLLREMEKESGHYQDVVEIEAAAQRCKSIIQSLLEFARQQPINQKATLNQEAVDIREAVLSAVKLSRVGRTGSQVDIEEDWATETLTVTGNRNRVTQVFLNLVQNAFQAMPDGGTLTLSSRKQGQHVIVEVKDTGIGIAPNHIKKIFDPFFTSKSTEEGTGLGLSICHGIVEDMGGRIEVESQVNKGSVFRVILPLKKAQKKRKTA